jgi:Holliday junction resolvase RusA-like endonuclease
MIKITVLGNPIAKARPRFYRRGKFVGTYNAQETEEGKFMLLVKEQFNGDLIEGPIDLWIKFFMPIPKSTSKKNRKSMNSGLIRHTKRPDLDNLVKFTKDCLNEIVWKDDSQVCRLEAWKKYDTDPRTEIIIFNQDKNGWMEDA